MKIYDCFSYWDEDLLLDLRLNILNEYVDFFVIIEGNKTWQNNFKKFRFNIEKFKKLLILTSNLYFTSFPILLNIDSTLAILSTSVSILKLVNVLNIESILTIIAFSISNQ